MRTDKTQTRYDGQRGGAAGVVDLKP